MGCLKCLQACKYTSLYYLNMSLLFWRAICRFDLVYFNGLLSIKSALSHSKLEFCHLDVNPCNDIYAEYVR